TEHRDGPRTGALEERATLGYVGECRGGRARREDLDRQRIERACDDGASGARRPFGQSADEHLMADVDAVEDADRDVQRTTRPAREVMDDGHARRVRGSVDRGG